METFLTSSEVMARTGISARQLQWWDEKGIVVPAREGHRRLYSMDDLAEVVVICDLRKRGFSLQRVRKVIRLLQKEFRKRLVETVSAHSEYHLLTDGKRIFLETSAEQVIDILKNSQQPMLTLCLTDTVRQIRRETASGTVEPALVRSAKSTKVAARKPAATVSVRVKRAAM